MKNILIIYAHPDEESFSAAILNQTVSQLKKNRHAYRVIDLYRENYNPVLSKAEIKGEISQETKNISS
jgi:NAD(P)H dehydrogenase (quinone)